MSPQIVVLGSVNVDLVIRGPRLPQPGETVLGGRFFQAGGGKGANQAVAAARAARRPVVFIAAVGDDDYGRQALESFRREKMRTEFIRTVKGEATGVALIMVDAEGENLISVASGANAHLAPGDVDALPDDLFTPGGVFLTCLESPLATVERALVRAKVAGMRTILNPAPADAAVGRAELAPWVDWLTPNEGEAAALAGLPTDRAVDPLVAAHKLQQSGYARVIVTLGPAGCLVVDEQAAPISGHKVEAVDATAAGDSFNGALAVALLEGLSPLDAARWANRVAAITVTRAGAQPSLPTRGEIDAFAGCVQRTGFTVQGGGGAHTEHTEHTGRGSGFGIQGGQHSGGHTEHRGPYGASPGSK